jgi:hypothetical protein
MVVITWQFDLQLPMQPMSIINDVVILISASGSKFVSEQQTSGFLLVFQFSPPLRLAIDITKSNLVITYNP